MEPVLTICGEACSRSGRIAREAARELGYRRLPFEEVVLEAAARYGASAARIRQAFRVSPRILGMSPRRRRRHAAYLAAILTELALPGGVVYDGPAGHLVIRGVAHTIRALVTAPLPLRARWQAEREGIPASAAEKALAARDAGRRRALEIIFGVEARDPGNVDLTIDTGETDPAVAVERLVAAAREPRYRPETWSRRCMEQVALAARARAAALEVDSEIRVTVEDGVVTLRTRARGEVGARRLKAIRDRLSSFDGVRSVEIEYAADPFGGWEGALR